MLNAVHKLISYFSATTLLSLEALMVTLVRLAQLTKCKFFGEDTYLKDVCQCICAADHVSWSSLRKWPQLPWHFSRNLLTNWVLFSGELKL